MIVREIKTRCRIFWKSIPRFLELIEDDENFQKMGVCKLLV